MFETNCGIVLHKIPHNDTLSIVHIYTAEHGCEPFALRLGNSKKSRIQHQLFAPFTILNMEVERLHGRDLQKLIEVQQAEALPNLRFDMVKNSISFFLAEFLGTVLYQTEKSEQIFNFLYQSIFLLNGLERGVANFHIAFLVQFSYFMGIKPDESTYNKGWCFDLENGVFVPPHSLGRYQLSEQESISFLQLLRINYSNMQQYQFTRDERYRVLMQIIDYYRLHHCMVGKMKSLEVLRILFD